MILYYFILFIIIITLLIINFKLESISKKLAIYDRPDNLRKFHKNTTPVIGWIHILITLVFLLIFSFIDKENTIFKSSIFEIYNEEYIRAYISLFIGAFSIFFIGVYDDKHNVPATKKSLILIGILYLLINFDKSLIPNEIYFDYFDYVVYLENFAVPFTILSIFFLINSLNLYDGTNLQSGVFLSFVYVILILKGIFSEFFLIILISNLFFIYKNYNGKLFYGDAGIFLNSYIISYFILKSYNANVLSTDLIIIIFFLPALDLIRLFIMRLFFLRNPFIGDRNHFHHILAKIFKNNILIINLLLLLIFSAPIIFYEYLNISFIISFIPSLLFYFSLVIYFYIYKKSND